MYVLQALNEYFAQFVENDAQVTTNKNEAMQFAFEQDAINFNFNYLDSVFVVIFDASIKENAALVNYD